jgi:hypothetical protein
MKRLPALFVVFSATLLAMPSLTAEAPDLRARLIGFEEVPAISTTARGRFTATIDEGTPAIEYELRYQGLQADITQSHIHFGRERTNGGISVWLCGTPTLPGPAGTPACGGPRTNTVTGVITPAQVIGPSGQGITAGEFNELLKALKDGSAYANVHSTTFPGGEIRGQIRDGKKN